MKGFLFALGGIVVLGGIVLLFYMSTYNGLVSREQNVNEKWSQVGVMYQRRADLIPRLVETVKGVAKFEKETLIAVVQARAKVGSVQVNNDVLNDPEKFRKFEAAQGELSSALSRLLVVMEKYPDLKATENFSSLQSELEGTENRVAVARRDFNESVREYNTAVRSMPTNVVAALGGFKEKAFFQVEQGAEKAPEVKF